MHFNPKITHQQDVQPLPSGSYVWKTLLACSEGASGATRAISFGEKKKERKKTFRIFLIQIQITKEKFSYTTQLWTLNECKLNTREE